MLAVALTWLQVVDVNRNQSWICTKISMVDPKQLYGHCFSAKSGCTRASACLSSQFSISCVVLASAGHNPLSVSMEFLSMHHGPHCTVWVIKKSCFVFM